MPTNMLVNPNFTPTITYEGLELLYVEVEENELVFTGAGATYGRAIFDLNTPLVASETYLLEITITEVSGGVNPRLQITQAEDGPLDLVSGENRFTVREDIEENGPSQLMIKGSGTLVTARISGLSLTE